MPAIRFEQVTKEYLPGKRVVGEVSLEVEQGELVVLLGPSGCGKTTLLKMVNRLIEPTSGTVRLADTDVRAMPVHLLRRQIGYVIQQVGLFPHMTTGENIAVTPTLLGWDKARIQQRIFEMLDLVGLPAQEFCNRYPAQLSGGQQQRVGVARALAGDPKVLLMDEPFGAIDAITRFGLETELVRLHRTLQKTILFVTHDVEEALMLANRIAVMRAGKVIQYDTPYNILNNPADEAIAGLVGAGDPIRKLGLILVEAAMEQTQPGEETNRLPVIGPHESLRAALSLLLQSGAPELCVQEGEIRLGRLTLGHIRGCTARHTESTRDPR